MRYWIAIFILGGALGGAAIAQDAVLRSLQTGVDASPWEAVGRLNIGGNSFCTGALIAPDIVLTAAHCLYDSDTGDLINHDRVEFLAGWRNGRASAYRKVRRTAIHPGYIFDEHVSSERVRNDLALLKLDHEIRNTTVIPFGTSTRPDQGARVGVVSYARDRSNAPSLQEVCQVLGMQDGVLITSCTVDYGSSGAPIFSFSEGSAKIVSVVSAMAEIDGQKVSLGTDLDLPLKHLRAELDRADESVPQVSGAVSKFGAGSSGAKFVRPEQ
mgnify:CR=1 FL=1